MVKDDEENNEVVQWLAMLLLLQLAHTVQRHPGQQRPIRGETVICLSMWPCNKLAMCPGCNPTFASRQLRDTNVSVLAIDCLDHNLKVP